MAASQLYGLGEMDLESVEMGLPIANAENKKLEAEVQSKEKEIASLEQQAEQLEDRVKAMSDHLKNVRQELHQTQSLHEARKKDVETEYHMRQVAEREDGRMKDELKRLESEQTDLREKQTTYENTVFRMNQKIEELKAQMNWDQQALETWLEESAHRDEDAMILAKYARVDEDKVREMTLRLEQRQENCMKRRKLLDSETTETLTAQIELDKTATSFRRAHADREELIRQWELTIHQMRRRDADMDKCSRDLAGLKAEMGSKNAMIKEKQEFLDSEKRNNSEKEKKSSVLEREAAQLRLTYQGAEENRMAFTDELETLKYSVNRTAGDLDKARTESGHLGQQTRENRRRMETLQHQREIMQEEMKKSTQKMLSAEERAQEVDQVMAEEEEEVERLQRELEKSREKQFKLAQQVFELKGKEKNMAADIQGGRATYRNLGSKQNKLDNDILKQQEILYTQDFQLQQLQHKLNRLEGERTDDEKITLQTRIKELEGQWEEQEGEEQMLSAQLKRVQEDLRRLIVHLEEGKREKAVLEEKIDEINLHIDNTQRELKRVVAAKQDKMVDENIVRLDVKRLRDALFSHTGEVYSLEKHQLELHTAMTERNKEISLHKDMIRTQSRALETERQTISLEVHERFSKIDKLRKRYEIISVTMATGEEGQGEGHSQVYYVIKAAQEKEELQRRGDEYDSKIRRAEKEIRALENTLQVMGGRNEKFRKTLTKVDHSGEEVDQLNQLEGQWRAAHDKLRHKKKHVRQLEGDLQTMDKTLATISEDKMQVERQLEEKQAKMAATVKELSELKAKRDRLSKLTTRVTREVRERKGSSLATDIEDDIELNMLQDFGQKMVQQVAKVTSKQPDLVPTMQLLFSQAGLPPPRTPSSSRTSSALSSCSSATQLSGRSSSTSTPLKTRTIELGRDLAPPTTSSPTAGTSRAGSQMSSRSVSVAGSRHSPRPGSHSHSSSHSSFHSSSRASADMTIRPS